MFESTIVTGVFVQFPLVH